MNNLPNENRSIYLDASATTPLSNEVLDTMINVYRTGWGNPSSIHKHGTIAAEILENSRWSIAKSLGADPSNIIFTSGATESINIGLLGLTELEKPARIVVSSVEHEAVINTALTLRKKGWEIAFWPVDRKGLINLEYIDELLSPPTRVVSIISAQNEIGTIQPINIISNECLNRNVIFHTDSTQYLSQALLNLEELAQLAVSASAHKLQGPKGTGILIIKDDLRKQMRPIIDGGSQEFGIRPGTEAVAQVAGMAKAISILYSNRNKPLNRLNKVHQLTMNLKTKLEEIPGLRFTGDPTNRLKNHISMLVGTNDGIPVSGRQVVRELAAHGLSASSGSACSSGKNQRSRILKAINTPPEWQYSGLRFSLGPWLEQEDINIVPDILNKAIIRVAERDEN